MSPTTVLTDISWRKSSRSGDQGACVEVAIIAGTIAVRDSKDPTGPALWFSPAAWAAFSPAAFAPATTDQA
jgi:hypothetical protein